LALPPDSSETFLREVDENLRRDQFQDFIKAYGSWMIAAVVLILAAAGGWIYWDNRQQKESAAQSEELHGAFTSLAQGQNDAAGRKLTALEDSHNDVVRASAVMADAALALDKNDRARALADYKKIAADDDYPQPYRVMATIRATSLEFDSMKPDEVIARLQPMAQAGNPFFGSAGEMTALALLKQGKKAEAGKMFAAVAADKEVPQSIRSRAAQIAGTLGTDASASMPSLDKQD
jgi:hypothetical protein